MGPLKRMVAVACSALLLTSAAATAQTTPPDRKTLVTFSGPVSIPGTTLPAGTYTFKLADSPANLHIVQVFDKEESKVFATLLAVPAERMEAHGDPVITFKETAADRPPAVRYWYYAGERAGNEFVYPKSQAMMIARASGESVMSVDTESTSIEDWKKGTPTRVAAAAEPPTTTTSPETTIATQPAPQPMTSTSASQSTASTTGTQPPTTTSTTTTGTQPPTTTSTTTTQPTPQPTPQPEPQPTPQPAAPTMTTPPVTTTAPTTAPTTSPTPAPTAVPTTAPEVERPVGTSGRAETTELPRTASDMPAVGLIGLLALAGAIALRVARRAAL